MGGVQNADQRKPALPALVSPAVWWLGRRSVSGARVCSYTSYIASAPRAVTPLPPAVSTDALPAAAHPSRNETPPHPALVKDRRHGAGCAERELQPLDGGEPGVQPSCRAGLAPHLQ